MTRTFTWTSTAKNTTISRPSPKSPAESFGNGFFSSFPSSNSHWIISKNVLFRLHLKNRSEHSHTRSWSCRLLEEGRSVPITSGSSCERDKGIRSKHLVHFFSSQDFNLASVRKVGHILWMSHHYPVGTKCVTMCFDLYACRSFCIFSFFSFTHMGNICSSNNPMY